MKPFSKLIKESLSEKTWADIQDDDNVEWLRCNRNDFSDFFIPKFISNKIGDGKLITRSISVHEFGTQFILISKNNDPLVVIYVDDLYGWENFKNLIIGYGYETIIIYDTDDFSHKIIYTR